MVKRAAIEQVGAFDKRFFYYWEETDWCIRLKRAGWQIIHAPQAKLWHKGVQRNYQPKPSVAYYRTRNHLLTLAKHKAPLTARLMTFFQIARTLVSWSVKPRWRHMRPHRDAMWRGVVDFFNGRWGMTPPR
jgi:GT2 family glycosyltransferase